jgi:hypothetical protein
MCCRWRIRDFIGVPISVAKSALAHRCAARTGQRQNFPDNDGFNEWPKHSCERATGFSRATQLSFARNTGLYLGESDVGA